MTQRHSEPRLQSGTVYMTSIRDLDNPVMGVIVRRMWWKPWRWALTPIYFSRPITTMGVSETREGMPITNLTKLGAIGLAKLYGVRHVDFERSNFDGEMK